MINYRIVVDSCGEFTEDMKKNPHFAHAALHLSIDGEQTWRQKHKRKFQRLRHSGQNRAQRCSQKKSCCHLLLRRICRMVHGQCRSRKSKDHDRKISCHIHSCLSIDTCSIPEAVQIRNSCEIKPEYRIQHMMKSGRDQ